MRIRARARQSTDDDEKEFLTSLWKNALDICSLASIITAFEDCKDTGGYDLGTVHSFPYVPHTALPK